MSQSNLTKRRLELWDSTKTLKEMGSILNMKYQAVQGFAWINKLNFERDTRIKLILADHPILGLKRVLEIKEDRRNAQQSKP